MNTLHIKTTHQYGEVHPNVFDDFEWVKAHEDELLEQYGVCTILVYEQTVIGYGKSDQAALENAENNLPDNFDGVITPITYYLAKRQPFYRVQPVQTEDEN